MKAALTTLALCTAAVGARAQDEWADGFGAPLEIDFGHTPVLEVYDDGTGPALYAGGQLVYTLGNTDGLVRWDGSDWTAVGGGIPSGNVKAMVVFEGSLIVGGSFGSAGGVSVDNIAAWDGTSWSALGDEPGWGVNVLEVYDAGPGSDPKLIAGGDSNGPNGMNHIAAWDGTSWSSLDNGLNLDVNVLHARNWGGAPVLCAGGEFTAEGGVGGTPLNHFALWQGALWVEVGGGLDEEVTALGSWGGDLYAGSEMGSGGVVHVYSGGWQQVGAFDSDVFALVGFYDGGVPALFAGGTFSSVDGSTARGVAIWDGSGWTEPGGGVTGTVAGIGAFQSLELSGRWVLAAGGDFEQAGSAQAEDLALWDGSSWSPMGSAVGDPSAAHFVRALASFDDGSGKGVYAGGFFEQAGGVQVNSIGRLDHLSWSPLDCGVDCNGVPHAGAVHALAVWDELGAGDALYVGGTFGDAGGLANTDHVARWDGASWSSVAGTGGEPGDDVHALAVHDDGYLYGGGAFAGQGLEHVAQYDGAEWNPLGGGTDGDVYALCSFGQNLYAGGEFTQVDGVVRPHVAAWEALGGFWLNVDAGVDAAVHAMTTFSHGGESLYLGGDFTDASGTPANYIVEWDGAVWSALGIGLDGPVYALAVFDEGNGDALYVGGDFTTAGGVSAPYLARWDGTAWSALGLGLDGPVRALLPVEDGSQPRALYAGGEFTTAGGGSSVLIARWDPKHGPGEAYCTSGTTANGCAGYITSVGLPSRSQPFGFHVIANEVDAQRQGIFYFGQTGRQAVNWFNGTAYQCVSVPVKRTGVQLSTGTFGLCDGIFQLDFNEWMWRNPNKAPMPGLPTQVQCWYRDPVNTAPFATTTLTSAFEFTVAP